MPTDGLGLTEELREVMDTITRMILFLFAFVYINAIPLSSSSGC